MNHARRFSILLAAICLASQSARAADEAAARAAAEEFFENRIRPVLVHKCLSCHGQQTAEHGLRLDSADALLKGGESGPAIVPGRADESLLITAVRRTRDDLQMPPDEPLPAEVIADLGRWV